MDKIRSFLLNPNVHGVLALIGQISAFIPGPWQAAAQIIAAVSATLTGVTVLLPEKGSLHGEDYAKIVQAVSDNVTKAVAGRS